MKYSFFIFLFLLLLCCQESSTESIESTKTDTHTANGQGEIPNNSDSDTHAGTVPDPTVPTDTNNVTGTTGTDNQADTESDSGTIWDTDSNTNVETTSDLGLTIYYIRHAQTVANTLPHDEMTIENASQFSELGHTQVQELTSWLIDSGIVPIPDKVLVSPTWRGQYTISPYLVQMNLTGEIWPELTEGAHADPVGDPIPADFSQEQYIRYAIEADNLEYRAGSSTNAYFPQTFEESLTMVMWLKDGILEEFSQSGKTIFVIGHAHAGRMLLGLLEGHDLVESNPSYPLFNTGVTHVEQDPETSAFTVIDQNINNPTGAPTWGR